MMTPTITHQWRHIFGLSVHGFHRVAYKDWGGPSSRIVVCAHGLTRNSVDFDYLASALAPSFRMICPDIVGRGHSARLPDSVLYDYPQYVSDMGVLFARLGAPNVHWIGSSMGGIIGMFLAALPLSPVHSLVLNDIGATISAKALLNLYQTLCPYPTFSSFDEAKTWMEKTHSDPYVQEEQWNHFLRHSLQERENSLKFVPAYDPSIMNNIQRIISIKIDANFWHIWNLITCPVLIIRGSKSRILTKETVEQMMKVHTGRCETITVDGAGHIPMLSDSNQIKIIQHWLNSI